MKKKFFFVFLSLFFLSSCSNRSVHFDETLSIPDHFLWQNKPHHESSYVYTTSWWENWPDPVLKALITQALKNNHDIRSMQASLRESRALLGQAQSLSLPQGTLSTQKGYQKVLLPESQTFGAQENSFSVSWEADLFGQNKNHIQSLREQYDALGDKEKAFRLLLSTEIGQLYIQLLVLEKNEKLLSALIKEQEHAVALSQQLWRMGLIDGYQKNNILHNEKQLILKKQSIQNTKQSLLIRLGIFLGETPEAFLKQWRTHPSPSDHLDALEQTLSVPSDPLPLSVLHQRWDVNAQRHRVIAALHEVGAAKAAFFPHLSFLYRIATQKIEITQGTLSAPIYDLGFSLALPLFSGGRLRNQLEAKKQDVLKEKEQYELSVIRALGEVETAYHDFYRWQKALKEESSLFKDSQKSAEKADYEYHSGFISYLKKVQITTKKMVDNMSLNETKGKKLQALIHLYKAMGGYWKASTISVQEESKEQER